MSKTIEEIRTAKSALEKQIASMLSDFERDNEVEVSSCYCGSYSFTPPQDESTVVPPKPIRALTFEITVKI